MSVSAVAATAVPDGSPCPHAKAIVSGIVGQTITLRRTSGGQSAVVRGVYKVPVLGSSMEFWDYEAPFGVPVAYRAEVVSGGGTAMAQSAPVTLNVDRVWISDPLSPKVSCAAELVDSLGEFGYDRAGTIAQVVGDSTPIAMVGTRQEASNVPVVFRTRTALDRLSVMTVLRATDPLLIRCPGDLPFASLPPLAYVTCGRIVERPMNANLDLEDVRIEFPATVVRPPTASVQVAPNPYQKDLDDFPRYLDSLAAQHTYADRRRGGV